jgi:quercetin dioxygenase-like cupin family protein
MKISRRSLPSALLNTLALSTGLQEDPKSLIWKPENILWQPDDPPGAKYAVLDGDRERKGGLFTYAFWLPAGAWAPVHKHSQSAHVAVMQGSLRLGFGPVANRAETVLVRAGEFFIVRGNQLHFEGAEEDCLIIGTAQGGWKTTVVGK